MNKTALLILDVQAGHVSRLKLPPTYFPLLSKTIDTARDSAKVIYTTVGFRPGHPDVAASNFTFYPYAKRNVFVSGSPETLIDPAITPQKDDIIVEKKRMSAFSGGGLDVILKSLGVETVVLTGTSTARVVLSTLCEAADKDYKVIVLRDLCADGDEELHNMLMDQVFKKRGEVINADEWLERLKA
ncbi:isochorismatase family protein [Xylogone sp. PMI_703]|nr:isochorismatase family protein [Xylogone sp. PMI_703]